MNVIEKAYKGFHIALKVFLTIDVLETNGKIQMKARSVFDPICITSSEFENSEIKYGANVQNNIIITISIAVLTNVHDFISSFIRE